MVLIGKNREAATRLLNILEKGIEQLGMEINYSKTKYLEFNPQDKEPLPSDLQKETEKEVNFEINYKYLGVELHLNGRQSIFQEFYKTRLARAKSYAGSISNLAAKSHDPVEVANTLWLKTAIPSILYGCEVASFTKNSIEDLESIQAQMGASILGVPSSSAHIGILIELGWPSLRSRIYERKMKYFHRVNGLSEDMLVSKVMSESLAEQSPTHELGVSAKNTGNKKQWKSKYKLEIKDITERCQIDTLEPGKNGVKVIKELVTTWELTNKSLSKAKKDSLQWQPRDFLFTGKQPYIDGSNEAIMLARFRLGNAISQMEKRSKTCILCDDSNGNNEAQLLFSCKKTEGLKHS